MRSVRSSSPPYAVPASDLARRLRPLWQHLLAWSRRPSLLVVVGAASLVAMAASLPTGFAADDHLHRVILRGRGEIQGFGRGPDDLFAFSRGRPSEVRALMNRGIFPWWTHERVKLAFWRPLSAWTHEVDAWLWPDRPSLHHLHSLLWWALALVAVCWAAHRLMPTAAAAGLLFTFYALDDGHGPAVGWIANRNALLSLTGALLVVVLHRRSAFDDSPRARWWAPVALLGALLTGEAAVGALAFVGAHALCLESDSPLRRAARLAPLLLVLALWSVTYRALGYGAAHSGVYLDPGADPLRFGLRVLEGLPLLLQAQFAGLWSDWYVLVEPDGFGPIWLAALVLTMCAWCLLVPWLRRDGLVRFWSVSLVASIVPLTASPPADRLLVVPSFAAAGLSATVVSRLASPPDWLRARPVIHGLTALGMVGLVGINLVLGPLALPLRARSMVTMQGALDRADHSLPAGKEVRTRTIVALTAPGDPFLSYVDILRASEGRPRPRALRLLANAFGPVQVHRTGPRTLVVRPERGYVSHPVERMTRDPRDAMMPGTVVTLDGVRVEVLESTADGRPWAVEFAFSVPLEDESLIWVRWQDRRFRRVAPPRPGERLVLPAVDLLAAVGLAP